MDDDRQDVGSDSRPQGDRAGWVPFAAAGALVLLVGIGAFVIAGLVGGGGSSTGDTSDGDARGSGVATHDEPTTPEVIAGRWFLESWQEGDRQMAVSVGVNALDTPWIEFAQTFAGQRDTFISGDGSGTAGEFSGWSGCNTQNGRYEYSASFLVLVEPHSTAQGCNDRAEEVILSMLFNTPDGIEVIMRGDTMEWYGSNLERVTWPLTFRRDGAPPPSPANTGDVAGNDVGDEPNVRVFDVGGVEVVTAIYGPDLPEHAEVVQFWTTVIDAGDGPELCLGGVAESLPPQCSGPVVPDLAMGDWTEEAQGVRWGERGVIVTWPPVNGEVQLLEEFPYEVWEFDYPVTALPKVCVGVDVGAGPINDYARSLGDASGGLYLSNDGVVVLQVVGDPRPHRDALAAAGGACVIEVARSESEQHRIQNELTLPLAEMFGQAGFGTAPGPGGRVDIVIPVADQATALAIADLVDDPTAIRIVGVGIVV